MAITEFINGITQGFVAPRGFFKTERAAKDTQDIAASGFNWVALVVNQFQETFGSTRIFDDNHRTVGDIELVEQIRKLQSLGLHVMLKPMLEPLDSIYRGDIRMYGGNILADTETNNVAKWYESYDRFIMRYAEIAQMTHCDMYCIGCELNGMEYHPREWRHLIKEVRAVYSGPVTYNLTMNITEFTEARAWMKDLDIVGISGYFKVAPADRSADFKEMCAGWQPWAQKLEAFHQWTGKPLFFAETGARPIVGAAGITGGYNAGATAYADTEQADYYLSTVTVLSAYPWFYGAIWWKWDEHQHRPNYYLPDGHYVGCEPTPAMLRAVKQWTATPIPREPFPIASAAE